MKRGIFQWTWNIKRGYDLEKKIISSLFCHSVLKSASGRLSRCAKKMIAFHTKITYNDFIEFLCKRRNNEQGNKIISGPGNLSGMPEKSEAGEMPAF